MAAGTSVRPSLGVIVYLTQARHSSYGRDSLKLLRDSLRSLVESYLAEHRDDVLFLHYGEVPADQQRALISQCGQGVRARFMTLPQNYTTVPPGTPPQSTWLHSRKFSAGYRHMIRLFTTGLWPLVAAEGYEYVMRMDEDSFFHSNIRYNIFERMRSRGIDYAYRLASWDEVAAANEPFHAFVRKYLTSRPDVKPTWIFDSCINRSALNFTLRNCGNLYGFYNNFFVSRVAWWLAPDVQDWLRFVDASHSIYTKRWNDILWQSAAVQIFMPLKRVHMMRDFAYEHATYSKTKTGRCVRWGGLALGTTHNQSRARARLRQIIGMPACRERSFNRRTLRPCMIADRANTTAIAKSPPRALLFGAVSDQEAHCSRPEPRPYHCTLGLGARAFSEALRQDGECECAPSSRTRSSKFWRCYCRQLQLSQVPACVQ